MSEWFVLLKRKKQFKVPFVVLLDLPFIRYMQSYEKTHHHLTHLLNKNKVNLRITGCCADEMDHASMIQTLKDLHIKSIICKHNGKMSASDCIVNHVEDGNQFGYLVATGRGDLVSELLERPMVPVITNEGKGMVLRRPSDNQRKAAENDDDDGVHMGAERGHPAERRRGHEGGNAAERGHPAEGRRGGEGGHGAQRGRRPFIR